MDTAKRCVFKRNLRAYLTTLLNLLQYTYIVTEKQAEGTMNTCSKSLQQYWLQQKRKANSQTRLFWSMKLYRGGSL